MGYMAVVDTINPELKEVIIKHLCELMADIATYGCELVHTYHAVRLQQLESRRLDLKDAKYKFCRSLV